MDVTFDQPRSLKVLQEIPEKGKVAATAGRSSLYRSESEAMKQQIGSNKFVTQTMNPFDLDGLVNPKKARSDNASFFDDDDPNKRNNLFGSRLYDQDFEALQEFERS